jgi:hypothetical protein
METHEFKNCIEELSQRSPMTIEEEDQLASDLTEAINAFNTNFYFRLKGITLHNPELMKALRVNRFWRILPTAKETELSFGDWIECMVSGKKEVSLAGLSAEEILNLSDEQSDALISKYAEEIKRIEDLQREMVCPQCGNIH